MKQILFFETFKKKGIDYRSSIYKCRPMIEAFFLKKKNKTNNNNKNEEVKSI